MIKGCALITDTNAGMRRSGPGLGDRGKGQRAPVLRSIGAHSSCDASLLARSHTAPGLTAFPAFRRFPAKEENCCLMGCDTRAAGLFARAAGKNGTLNLSYFVAR